MWRSDEDKKRGRIQSLHKNGWISNYSFYAMHEAEEFREKQMYPESYTVIRVKVSQKQKKPNKGQLLDVIGAVRRCKYALKALKGWRDELLSSSRCAYLLRVWS